MQNIWPDNNVPELIPAGYVKVVPTHNLPVFSCVPQAQYINSLAIKQPQAGQNSLGTDGTTANLRSIMRITPV
ncbi:hypothetical protein FHP00_27630 [Escherichia coli]|nr:hypothetical protein [Escherichia coli]EFC0430507.1 hypothetical protein [Escherichia coli]EFH9021689.1 hypothetical protein [Escherichia coli]EFN5035066.1 hypothetical protein [Escherichia coli]EFN7384203.1 hypothetical protein [Escherichia coli]